MYPSNEIIWRRNWVLQWQKLVLLPPFYIFSVMLRLLPYVIKVADYREISERLICLLFLVMCEYGYLLSFLMNYLRLILIGISKQEKYACKTPEAIISLSCRNDFNVEIVGNDTILILIIHILFSHSFP